MYSKTVISHKTDVLQSSITVEKKIHTKKEKQQYFSFHCEIQLSIYYILYIIIVIVSKLTCFVHTELDYRENLLPAYSSNILQQK